MQSQQLLPKGEVLHEEFFSGAKDGDHPAKQMSKARKHQGIIAKSAPGKCASKSLILLTRRVLARHKDRLRLVDQLRGISQQVRPMSRKSGLYRLYECHAA